MLLNMLKNLENIYNRNQTIIELMLRLNFEKKI